MHCAQEWHAVSEFFQSRRVQWFKTKRLSVERGIYVNLMTRDTDLAKVYNGYPCQKVKFQKSMKSTILYSESEVVDFGISSIDPHF